MMYQTAQITALSAIHLEHRNQALQNVCLPHWNVTPARSLNSLLQ